MNLGIFGFNEVFYFLELVLFVLEYFEVYGSGIKSFVVENMLKIVQYGVFVFFKFDFCCNQCNGSS